MGSSDKDLRKAIFEHIRAGVEEALRKEGPLATSFEIASAAAMYLLSSGLSEIPRMLSFDEWKQAGYGVKAGEKSVFRHPTTNVALFTRNQVEEREPLESMGHEDS